MASPVDTSVKYILSTMSGAPTLPVSAGSLVGLLDAFLVDGWGLQTATSVVVSGGVATVTFPSTFPAMVDSVVLVAGATPSDLNGEQKVTQVLTATNQIRFATALPNGTATGTITVKMAPAGWAKVFSGTNKAVYRSLNPQAHAGGRYFRIDDTSVTIPRLVGYETMSDVDTGTGPFPTNTQVAGGAPLPRYYTTSGPVRPYALFADSRTVYLAICPYLDATTAVRGFGDGIALRPAGDPHATFVATATNVDANASAGLEYANAVFWAARGISGLGGSEQGTAVPYLGPSSEASGASTIFGAFPSYVDGGLYLCRKFGRINQTSNPPRFDFPGMYFVPHSGIVNAFVKYETTPGSGQLAGRSLMFLSTAGGNMASSPTGGCFFDVTGPWR